MVAEAWSGVRRCLGPIPLGGTRRRVRSTGKKSGPRSDYLPVDVSCDVIRESVSTSLDGEEAYLPVSEIELHLAGCDVCRHWQEAAHEVTRQFRLQGAEEWESAPDDLRAAVVAMTPRRHPSLVVLARLALVGVALAATARLLLSGPFDSLRNLGTLEVALVAGYLVAAVRPRRAVGMQSIVGTAALVLVGSALLDLAHHRTTLSYEAPHLITLAGWLLIVFLARRTPDFGSAPSAPRRRTGFRSRQPSSVSAESSLTPPPVGRHRPR
jgi:RNA polymerase sigma-70 factor, ECF subfamily